MCTSIIINGFKLLAKKYPLCMKCGKILLLQNIVQCSEAATHVVPRFCYRFSDLSQS